MLILDQENTYGFANATIKIVDETYEDTAPAAETEQIPEFNVLIPTVQAVGMTNTLELYQPGDQEGYRKAHSTPNALKYGFGPNFVDGILGRGESRVGVYHINLRGPSASMANAIIAMKYRVEENVPFTDSDGNQYYVDENGQLTTDPTDKPVIRDVLHLKFVKSTLDECKKWVDLLKALNAMVDDTADDDGYKTMPWWGVLYRGATSYANDIYFNLVGKTAEYDGNMYYAINLFNGQSMLSTDPVVSFDYDSGVKYNTSYYIENQFNKFFPSMRFISAEPSERISEIIGKYLYTVEDYLNDRMDTPSVTFSQIDPFTVSGFGITVDAGSIDSTVTNAFALENGSDGTETPNELFKMFFNGEILGDIASVLRYRVNYIPDTGYDDPTKEKIRELVEKRNHMTVATLMLGNDSGFDSAVIEHQRNWYETMPDIRLLTRYQSPMMYDESTRRTMVFPATYFDTMALMDHFARVGNFYDPFAGAYARWTGYIEDTMNYPTETAETLQALYESRINVVMKDFMPGAYLSDQLMNTQKTSDQTELNNEFLISNMLYDLVELIHRNHFKFNETAHVRLFHNAVNDAINSKYKEYSASLSVEVQRLGTVGRAKSANKIIVTIDMRDINRYTNVELYLVDE